MPLVDYSLSSDEDESIPDRYDWLTPDEYDTMFGAGQSESLFARQGDLPLSHFYSLTEQSDGYSKNFKTRTTECTLTFKNLDDIDDLEQKVTSVFNLILNQSPQNRRSLMGLTIKHPAMDSEFIMPFMHQENMSGERVFTYIEKLLQSNKEIALDSAFKLTIVQITSPAGFGNHSKKLRLMYNSDEYRKGRSGHGGSFITIKNKDNLCCARALVVAKARSDKDPRWESIRKGESGRCKIQKELAFELTRQAGLSDFEGGCGVSELEKFQKVLSPNYQIKVYSKDLFNKLLFKGPPAEHTLCLLHAEDHFDVITSVPGFVGSSYYCHACEEGYNSKDSHNCTATCSSCRFSGICKPDKQQVYCKDCNRYLQSETCFNNHKQTKIVHDHKNNKIETSVCIRLKRCFNCQVQYRSLNGHQCGESYCKFCQKRVDHRNHLCYMQPYRKRPSTKRETLIFFDFETSQEKVIMDTSHSRSFEHQIVACVAQKICSFCRHSDLGHCKYCGKNEHIFKGTQAMEEFCNWLFSSRNSNSTVFAHNGKAFDCQFILKHLHTHTIKPEVIMRGRSIMCLKVGTIRILDSLSFLPWPLAQFPKAFNLSELKKGYFPHKFTRAENWNYDGPLPDISFYEPEQMKSSQRKDFLMWYEKNKGTRFDFQKELIHYCQSDVDILRRGCLTFQHDFIDLTGHNPFETAITIAQAVHEVYRKKFLPENKIALLPYHGYRPGDKFSKIAIKWLKWLSHTRNMRIVHGLNGGEFRIGNFKVDGMTGDGLVLEFNGCAFHGCPKCYPHRLEKLPLCNMTAEEAYQRTLDRKNYLMKKGYTVEEMWECELKEEIRRHPKMKRFFADIHMVDPLQPREAFFGGRTNAIKLYHEVKPGEKIHYVDVCSLYPWVCKNGVFPVGHPTIITEEFQNLDTKPYQGLIKCKVLPPRGLFHPVLPTKHTEKLCFTLCRTCLEYNENQCLHTDEERALTGTWVSLELYKAIELGYKILKIYEVWHFEKSCRYDGSNESECLFVSYINCFLKRKTEASGYPSNVKTEEEKTRFVEDYRTHEGIDLDPESIKKNPSYRQVSKLSLNSLWGKLAQRQNLEKTEYFTEPMEYFKCVFDPAKIVSGVRFVNDLTAMVRYSTHEDFIGVQPNKNVVIAAYVTAQARLKLYTYLELLQERVLYMDTDSVIYLSRPTDTIELPTGPYLGDLTNELDDFGPNAYITEYASGGAKNYGFKVYNPDDSSSTCVVKVKGIKVTSEISNLLNFDTMKEKVKIFVKSGCQEKIKVIVRRFVRDKYHSVSTLYSPKLYQVVYDKRYVQKDYNTLPFGF